MSSTSVLIRVNLLQVMINKLKYFSSSKKQSLKKQVQLKKNKQHNLKARAYESCSTPTKNLLAWKAKHQNVLTCFIQLLGKRTGLCVTFNQRELGWGPISHCWSQLEFCHTLHWGTTQAFPFRNQTLRPFFQF